MFFIVLWFYFLCSYLYSNFVFIKDFNIKENVINKRIEIEEFVKNNDKNIKYIIDVNNTDIDYNSKKFLVVEMNSSYRLNNLFKDYLFPFNFKDYFEEDIYKKWWVENYKKYLIQECKKSKDLYNNVIKGDFDNSFLLKLKEFRKITEDTCYKLWINIEHL